MRRLLALIALGLAGCESKGTLEQSRAEYVRVDGRRIEVRVAATEVAGEYRLLAVRDTIVVDPYPENERRRGLQAARPLMERQCRGRPYEILEDRLVDNVNLYLRFRCLG